jgi:4-amino-4-deoxy-L-arabinose transferase-like glycosyltransferase
MLIDGAKFKGPGTDLYLWIGLLALAVAVYCLGIGGQYVPTNGDELVYAHIARLTAASGHWLPLVSDLPNMRNTKPPLLFWQAMVAGDWGRTWHLTALRLPSLIYTFLTTGLVAWAVLRITRDKRRALLSACLYLAFFSTFRYGRPYLTSAPETFWLALPMFGLLFSNLKTKSLEAVEYIHSYALFSIAFMIFTGLAWGLASAYKSFALIAPAAAALWCASVLVGANFSLKSLLATSLQVGTAVVIGVGVFALWFVFDPYPAAVWREFVVGENIGKMGDKVGYWHEAFYGGGSSMWAQLLAYVENAGLLAFVVVGLAVVAFRNRTAMASWPPHAPILLAWLVLWVLVFMLPSQRSARYVIPAMPALAIVMALWWPRIPRGWFLASGGLILAAALVMGRIAWVMAGLEISTGLEFLFTATALAAVAIFLLASLAKPGWTRACTAAACLVFYGAFGLTVAPLDGAQGRYGDDVKTAVRNKSIAVPSNFNAQWERFEFLLPGKRIVPFDMAVMTAGDAASHAKLAELLRQHDAVVWGQADPSQSEPPCRPDCQVIASRWIVKERHKSGDITRANLWSLNWLFSREWIVTALR